MKEAFYFPHDVNAIQDPKMMTLLSECGAAGVGLYWIVVEILHQQEWGAIGVPELRQYLAFYGKQGSWDQVVLDKVERVLIETKLLQIDGDTVYSERVRNNKKKRIELSSEGRKNAFKRWGCNGVPMGTQCDPNAIKERKVKEKKEKNTDKNIAPAGAVALTPQADFVERFKQTYQAKTGQPYKADRKDFIIAADLIRTHGLDACVKKAMILGMLCESKSAWFTKDGWASYTLGKLSNQWNSIIPESMQLSKDQELQQELKKQEEMRERIDNIIKRR